MGLADLPLTPCWTNQPVVDISMRILEMWGPSMNIRKSPTQNHLLWSFKSGSHASDPISRSILFLLACYMHHAWMVIEGEVDEEKSGRDCDGALTGSTLLFESPRREFLSFSENMWENRPDQFWLTVLYWKKIGKLEPYFEKLENLNPKNLRPFLKISPRNKDKRKVYFLIPWFMGMAAIF